MARSPLREIQTNLNIITIEEINNAQIFFYHRQKSDQPNDHIHHHSKKIEWINSAGRRFAAKPQIYPRRIHPRKFSISQKIFLPRVIGNEHIELDFFSFPKQQKILLRSRKTKKQLSSYISNIVFLFLHFFVRRAKTQCERFENQLIRQQQERE